MPSDGFCPGPCNITYRKAIAQFKAALAGWDAQMAARSPGDPEPPRPEQPQVRPWYGSPVWCSRCTARIRAELAQLDYAVSIVSAYADGHRIRGGEQSKVSGTRSAPSASPASDAIDELALVLRSWESLARGGDPPARRGYLASEITETLTWLVHHFEPLITRPDLAEDFGSEISQWYRDLCRRGRSGTGFTVKPMPCSRCKHRSLRQRDGDKYIECSRKVECGRLLSFSEYEAEEEEWRRSSAPLKKVS